MYGHALMLLATRLILLHSTIFAPKIPGTQMCKYRQHNQQLIKEGAAVNLTSSTSFYILTVLDNKTRKRDH
ncbi:hypothetical protein WJX79_001670 [Trebouxia sp. C0005]